MMRAAARSGSCSCAVLAGAWSPAQADVGEIRLAVTDGAGAPVLASGTLASEAPQMRRSFTTDAEGRFTLGRVPFGIYVVTVEADGIRAAAADG